MKKSIWSLLYLLLLSSVAAAFEIKQGENPTLQENFAAGELKSYLERAAAKGVAIDGNNEVVFHIGDTDFARQNGVAPASMAADSYRIKSVGSDVILTGGGSRGTLYAVYAFLEKYAQIRWFSVDVESVPEQTAVLNLPKMDETVTPAFVWREIYPSNWRDVKDGGLWAVRNRLNGWGQTGIELQYGGAIGFGSPDSSHTFDKYFPVGEYMSTHPEFFALSDTKRLGGQFTGQLCLSNPQVVELTVEKLKKYIEQDEAAAAVKKIAPPEFYDISQNDNGFFCGCPGCAKMLKQYGAQSGSIIAFVNQVAREIKKFRPNVKISTLAYGATEKEPVGIKVEDNVVIRLTNTSTNKAASILNPEQKPYRDRIGAWKNLGASMYVWEYPTLYGVETPPLPNEFFFADLLKFYRDNGVKMVFFEYSAPPKDDMVELKMYLSAKLLENPDADVALLTKEFLAGYYGDAAESLELYRNLLFDALKKQKSYVFNSMESFTFFDLDTALKGRDLLEQATRKVAGNEQLSARVARVVFNFEQLVFMRYRKLTSEWLKQNKSLDGFPFDQKTLKERLRNDWVNEFPMQIRPDLEGENQAKYNQFDMLYGNLPDTVKPPKFRRFTPESIDLTVDFARVHSNKIVADPESSLGVAVFCDLAARGKSGVMPLVFGAYNDIKGGRIGTMGAIDAELLKKGGYDYHYVMTLKPEFSGYLYFLDDWTVQFGLDSAAAKYADRACDVYVSAKFSGSPYRFSSADAPYGIFIDRVILVPKR